MVVSPIKTRRLGCFFAFQGFTPPFFHLLSLTLLFVLLLPAMAHRVKNGEERPSIFFSLLAPCNPRGVAFPRPPNHGHDFFLRLTSLYACRPSVLACLQLRRLELSTSCQVGCRQAGSLLSSESPPPPERTHVATPTTTRGRRPSSEERTFLCNDPLLSIHWGLPEAWAREMDTCSVSSRLAPFFNMWGLPVGHFCLPNFGPIPPPP